MLSSGDGEVVDNTRNLPIAVVGMACRFPGGADNPSAFWECLVEGRDMVSDIPSNRYKASAFYEKSTVDSPLSAGSMYCKKGGFLHQDIEAFDASHFGISPREVVEMDPQQRLLLEVTWEAIENAGYSPNALGGSPTGVFFGMGSAEYLKHTLFSGTPERINSYTGTGNTPSVAPGRVSYLLGLQGPSIAIDTACSSSLVAVHLAMQSLQSGESELALAGGVNVMVAPELSIFLCSIGALSRSDRCHTFDEKADGYVRGEGCGIVVLKRLKTAQENGDNILAVLKGAAVNHDGRSAGLTVPNRAAQARVIRRALNNAGIQPEAVDYVEAHGTGTPLGDPIEVNALIDVMGEGRERPLIIGAVKTNVGHLEAAAGMAGLIKGILALQHEMIPPNLHFSKLNPHIDLSGVSFRFPSGVESWPVNDKTRILGVSSFGIGGTNAHVIVEEAPTTTQSVPEWTRTCHPLCFSANRPEALLALATNYVRHFETAQATGLNDVTYTAHTGRSHFPHRLAVLGETRDDIVERLSSYTTGRQDGNVWTGSQEYNRSPKVCFLFTGQGSQYLAMGKDLYDTQPVFRQALERCDKLLREHMERPLIELLYSTRDRAGSILNQTGYTQPALFAVEYSLCKLWQSWGVVPDVLLGHSVGEYVAACVAGVFGLDDALRLIAARARLMQALPEGGSMVSVSAGEIEVGKALAGLEDEASVAAFNGPDSLVVSGMSSAVDEVIARISRKGIECRPLQVSHAFHSPLMEPMLGEFLEIASALPYQSPALRLITNRTGCEAGSHELNASYWVEHVRNPVRFHDGLKRAIDLGCNVFIEMGPQPVLSGLGRRTVRDTSVSWLPSLRRGRSDWTVLAESVARFYTAGGEVDWAAFEAPYSGRLVSLPNYPFQREKFWVPAPGENVPNQLAGPSATRKGFVSEGTHPLLGMEICTAGDEIIFEMELSSDAPAYLKDHRVLGKVLIPATAFFEIALASVANTAPGAAYRLRNVKLDKPLVWTEHEATVLQTILRPTNDSSMDFAIYSRDVSSKKRNEAWSRHVSGELSSLSEDESDQKTISLDQLRTECSSRLPNADHFYESIQSAGFELGSSFQGLKDVWVGRDHSLGYIQLPAHLEETRDRYLIHPVLLDACIWVWAAGLEEALGISLVGESEIFLPAGIEELEVFPSSATELWCHAANFRQSGDEISGDLSVFDSTGRNVATLRKFYDRRTKRRSLLSAIGGDGSGDTTGLLHCLEWRAAALGNEPGSLKSEDWLILRDQQGVGDILAENVTAAGGQVRVVDVIGRPTQNIQSGVLQVDPKQPSDFKKLLETWVQSPADRRRIVYLWSLDAELGEQTSLESLSHDQELLCGSVLHLIQAMAGMDGEQPEFYLVTRGAQAVGQESGPLSPVQALLWGLGRTANNEHADIQCRLVDIDWNMDSQGVEKLFQELCVADGENSQVAYRNRERYVARLVKFQQENKLELPSGSLFQLEAKERGMLDSLTLAEADTAEPGPGEVKIEVRAMGLNFRDVLNALGMYPGDPGLLGGECAGEVIALGDGVDAFQLGQQVMCLAVGSFTSEVVVPAWWAMAIPAGMSTSQAATIPISFLTAYYALHHLAKLTEGERILIHAGAGGLGMAAIQLAKALGAEIYATAGNREKRDLLIELGVDHVMDSRSLAFADEIQQLTDGKGVDVVLNSLTGDFITRSLDSLATGGRFIEVGKVEILEEKFLEEKYSGVSYHFFDLADIMRSPSPVLLTGMFEDLRLMFIRGELKPLPLCIFPIHDAIKAFRYMQQAKHIGKIVLLPPTSIRADGTYIITGGAGALGLQVAKHFSDNGAGALILVSRRPMADKLHAQISRMGATGTRVLFLSVDIVDPTSNETIRNVLADGLPPLRGIVHAAGVLDDGMLAFHELSRFSPVLNPKVLGTWNLHRLSLDFRIDFFVLFSSAASIWGNPGQGNYAAANSFLDTLAHERRRQGLPAISINWSAWAGEGMAATKSGHAERVKDVGAVSAQNGIDLIGAADGLTILDSLLARSPAQIMVMPINWQVFGSQNPQAAKSAFLSELVSENQNEISSDDDFLKSIEAAPTGDHLQILYDRVEKLTVNVLGLDQSIVIDPHQPLHDMGLDSLMAVELCNVLGNCVQQPLPNTLLFDYGTLNDLTEYLAKILEFDEITVADAADESNPDDLLQLETANMSDAELEKSLLDELKDAGY